MGKRGSGGHTPPSGNFTKIVALRFGFVGLKTDGSIAGWGSSVNSSTLPTDTNYVDIIYLGLEQLAFVKNDGTLVGWSKGSSTPDYITSLPTTSDFLNAKFVTNNRFAGGAAALKSDGTIVSWGNSSYTDAPTDSGYTNIYASNLSFTAIKSDGKITQWGSLHTDNFQNASNISFTGVWGWYGIRTTIGYYVSTPEEYKVNSVIDNSFNTTYNTYQVIDTSGTIELTLAEDISGSDLQSIIIYNRSDTTSYASKASTMEISLMNNNTVLETYSPSSVNFAYKLKGGASDNNYTSTNTTIIDLSKIIDDTATIQSSVYNSDNSGVHVYDLSRVTMNIPGWSSPNGFTLLRGNQTSYGDQNITYGSQILGLESGQNITKTYTNLIIGGSYTFKFYTHLDSGGQSSTLSYKFTDNQPGSSTDISGNINIVSTDASNSIVSFTSNHTSYTLDLSNTSGGLIWIDNTILSVSQYGEYPYASSIPLTEINDGSKNTFHKLGDTSNGIYYIELADNTDLYDLKALTIRGGEKERWKLNSNKNYQMSLLDSSFNSVWVSPNYTDNSACLQIMKLTHYDDQISYLNNDPISLTQYYNYVEPDPIVQSLPINNPLTISNATVKILDNSDNTISNVIIRDFDLSYSVIKLKGLSSNSSQSGLNTSSDESGTSIIDDSYQFLYSSEYTTPSFIEKLDTSKNITDGILIDSSDNHVRTSFGPNQFIDITLPKYVFLEDIESIVVYNTSGSSVGMYNSTNIKLFDKSNTLVSTFSNNTGTPINANIIKYKGPSHNNNLSTVINDSSTNMISDDASNIRINTLITTSNSYLTSTITSNLANNVADNSFNTILETGTNTDLIPTHSFDFRINTPSNGYIIDNVGGIIKANYMNGITSSSDGVVFTGGARSDEEHPYINLDDFELGNNVSFESYFKFDSDSANYSRLFGFGEGNGTYAYWVAPANGFSWTLTSSNSTQPARIDYANSNLRDTFVHGVFTVSSSGELKMYINGSLVGTSTSSDSSIPNTRTRALHYLGRSTYNHDPYAKSTIKYFRIYKDKELSDSEVTTLYSKKNEVLSISKNLYQFVQLTLANSLPYEKLQSIVVYDNSNTVNGSLLSLYDENNSVIQTFDYYAPDSSQYNIYKYKGISYNDSLATAMTDSSTTIISDSSTNVFTSSFFNRIRIESEVQNSIGIDQFQIWINNQNVAVNITPNVSSIGNNVYYETVPSLFNKIRIDRNPIDQQFNKVKLLRTSFDLSYNPNRLININELQIWVNNENVALNGSIISSSTDGISNVNNIIDGNFTTYFSTSVSSELGEHITLTLNQKYNLSELESLVIYNRKDTNIIKSEFYGVSIQIMDDSNILHSVENTKPYIDYFRIDGTSINKVSTFDSSESTTNIISSDSSNVYVYNNLIKPFKFKEIQVWYDGSNIVPENSVITTDKNENTDNLNNNTFVSFDYSSNFYDITFNNSYDYNKLNSMIIYDNSFNTNIDVKYVKIQQTSRSIRIDEVELWIDNSNVALFKPVRTGTKFSAQTLTQINLQNGNFDHPTISNNSELTLTSETVNGWTYNLISGLGPKIINTSGDQKISLTENHVISKTFTNLNYGNSYILYFNANFNSTSTDTIKVYLDSESNTLFDQTISAVDTSYNTSFDVSNSNHTIYFKNVSSGGLDLGDLPSSIIGDTPTEQHLDSTNAYFSVTGNSDSWKNGNYFVTESYNEHQWRGFYAFQNTLGFLSSSVYSNGNYVGSNSTSHSGGSVNGTYVQIQFPFAFNPTGYKVQADATAGWSLLGSNDGSSWVLFSSDTGGSSLTSYSFSASGTYSYYRLVITTSSNTSVKINRIYVNGTYPVSNSLSIDNVKLYTYEKQYVHDVPIVNHDFSYPDISSNTSLVLTNETLDGWTYNLLSGNGPTIINTNGNQNIDLSENHIITKQLNLAVGNYKIDFNANRTASNNPELIVFEIYLDSSNSSPIFSSSLIEGNKVYSVPIFNIYDSSQSISFKNKSGNSQIYIDNIRMYQVGPETEISVTNNDFSLPVVSDNSNLILTNQTVDGWSYNLQSNVGPTIVNTAGNQVIKLSNNHTISKTFTGLEIGEEYRVYFFNYTDNSGNSLKLYRDSLSNILYSQNPTTSNIRNFTTFNALDTSHTIIFGNTPTYSSYSNLPKAITGAFTFNGGPRTVSKTITGQAESWKNGTYTITGSPGTTAAYIVYTSDNGYWMAHNDYHSSSGVYLGHNGVKDSTTHDQGTTEGSYWEMRFPFEMKVTNISFRDQYHGYAEHYMLLGYNSTDGYIKIYEVSNLGRPGDLRTRNHNIDSPYLFSRIRFIGIKAGVQGYTITTYGPLNITGDVADTNRDIFIDRLELSKTEYTPAAWTDSSEVIGINDNNTTTTYHEANDFDKQSYYIQLDDNIKFFNLSTAIIKSLDTTNSYQQQRYFNDTNGTNYQLSFLDSSFNNIWTAPRYDAVYPTGDYVRTTHIFKLNKWKENITLYSNNQGNRDNEVRFKFYDFENPYDEISSFPESSINLYYDSQYAIKSFDVSNVISDIYRFNGPLSTSIQLTGLPESITGTFSFNNQPRTLSKTISGEADTWKNGTYTMTGSEGTTAAGLVRTKDNPNEINKWMAHNDYHHSSGVYIGHNGNKESTTHNEGTTEGSYWEVRFPFEIKVTKISFRDQYHSYASDYMLLGYNSTDGYIKIFERTGQSRPDWRTLNHNINSPYSFSRIRFIGIKAGVQGYTIASYEPLIINGEYIIGSNTESIALPILDNAERVYSTSDLTNANFNIRFTKLSEISNITNNTFDVSKSFVTQNGINQYIELKFDKFYSTKSLQAILLYIPDSYTSYMVNTRLKIYDNSDTIIEYLDNIDNLAPTTGYNIYKYKGPDITNGITSDTSSSTNIISDTQSSIRIVDLSFNSFIKDQSNVNSFVMYTGNNYDVSDNGLITNSLHLKIFDSLGNRVDSIGEILRNKVRIIQGKMYHIAIVSGTSQLKLYIDGELIASESLPTYLQSQYTRENYYLGKGVDSNASISVPQMSIWNSELTSSEIQTIFNSDFSNNYYNQKSYTISEFLSSIGQDSSFNSIIDPKHDEFDQYSIDVSNNLSITGFPSYIGTFNNNKLSLRYININKPLTINIAKQEQKPTHNFNFKTLSTTTINDDFGGLTGTFMNGITSNINDGLVADGVDDYVDLGSITYGTSFSIELYVKPGTSMAWDDQFFHAANDINAATDAFWLSRYSTTQVNFFLVTNEGTNKHFTSPNSSDYNHSNSQWVHYVVTVSSNESTGGTVVVYVNNKSYTDIFTGTLETGTRTINAVGSPDTRHSYHRNGEMNVKHLRIWANTVLTADQVTKLYNERENTNLYGNSVDYTDSITFGAGNYLLSEFIYELTGKWNSKLNNLITFDGTDLLFSNDLSGYRFNITAGNSGFNSDYEIFNFNTRIIDSSFNKLSFNTYGNNPGGSYTPVVDPSELYQLGTIDWMNKHRIVVSYNDNSSIKILTDFSDNSGEFPYIIPTNFNGYHFDDNSQVKFYYYTDILNSEEAVNIDVSDNFGTQSFSVSKYNISYRAMSTLKDGGLESIPNHATNFTEIDNGLDNSATFTFYNDNSNSNQYILNPGTVYEFKVSSENDINNTPGTESDIIVGYTGIFTEEFTRNKINFTTNLLDNLIYPVNNTYYRLNDPTVSINTDRVNNDLSNALIKLSSVQGGGNNLIQIKDMIANYQPNFENLSFFSYFEAKLSSSSINEDISGNIIIGDLLDYSLTTSPTYAWDFRKTEPVQTTFNKVRIYSMYNNTHFEEIQVWIDGSNVAQNNDSQYTGGNEENWPTPHVKSTKIPSDSTLFSGHLSNDGSINPLFPLFYVDGINQGDYGLPIMTSGGLGEYTELTLSQSYDVSQLQAIIIYNRTDGTWYERMAGKVVELLDNSNLRYNQQIPFTDKYYIYKWTGPASIPSSLISTTPSSSKIVASDSSFSADLSYSTIVNYNISLTDIIEEFIDMSDSINQISVVGNAEGSSDITYTSKLSIDQSGLFFDGYTFLDIDNFTAGGNFSFEFYFYQLPKPGNFPVSNLPLLSLVGSSGSSNDLLRVRSESNQLDIMIRNSGNYSEKSGGVINQYQWHHVVGTIKTNPNEYSLYLDGIQLFNESISFDLSNSLKVDSQIGRSSYQSSRFSGYIKYSRMWVDTVLTQNEVTALYNNRDQILDLTTKVRKGIPINKIGTNLDITSLNYGDDELPEGTKFGYFDNQDINVKLKGFNASSEIYDLSFNNYLINSYDNVVDLDERTVKTIQKDPSSSILYGSNSLSIAVDDLSGSPSLTVINDSYGSGSTAIYYSGIPSMKIIRTSYGVDLQNIFNYWTKEVLCSVSYNSSSTVTIFSKDSNYYDYTDKVTLITKSSLTNGNVNDIHVKIENEDIILTSSVLYGLLTFNLVAFNVDSSQSLVHNKSYIHYDMSNESHPHILNNNISTYGERVFFNESVDFSSTYPSLSNLSILDNSANFSSGNYLKESFLFDGFYYGSNTSNIKKDWTTLLSSYNGTLRYDYLGINNDRFVTFKFIKNLVSKELIINFIENSIDDKELFIKYKTNSRETVWFNGNRAFNGRSVYAGNRNNNDGIRYAIKTANNFSVICPIGDNISIYIAVKIPSTNQNSKFKILTLDNIQV